MSPLNYVACIGPARSGTTWLYQYLRTHSHIATSHIKELNWFNTAMGLTHPDKSEVFRRRYERIMARRGDLGPNTAALECKRRYGAQTDADFREFCTIVASGQPIVDVSPGYALLSKAGFKRMEATFESAKIVLMLRNPADWAWSMQQLLEKVRSAENTTDFANNFSDQRIPDLTQASKPLHQIYDTAAEVIDAQNILCLFTEDLFDPQHQQATLDQLSAFVGVAPHPVDGFAFEKGRGAYDPPSDSFRAAAFMAGREDVDWAHSLMGRLPKSWQDDCARYFSA